MKRIDGETMRAIDQAIFAAQALKQRYLLAVDVCDDIPLPSAWNADSVQTHETSDPTADIALSRTRMANQSSLNLTRKNCRSAAELLHAATVHVGIILTDQ